MKIIIFIHFLYIWIYVMSPYIIFWQELGRQYSLIHHSLFNIFFIIYFYEKVTIVIFGNYTGCTNKHGNCLFNVWSLSLVSLNLIIWYWILNILDTFCLILNVLNGILNNFPKIISAEQSTIFWDIHRVKNLGIISTSNPLKNIFVL